MQNSNILKYIQDITSYVETNIKNDISVEKISKDLFISRFHLSRIFSAITGKTLKHYVNGRKLVHSLYDLLNTDMTLLDIALEYGYSFEQSFIRSFKKEFSITPNEYRKKRCELSITEIININNLTKISENSILLKPISIFKPSFYVIGDRYLADKTSYIDTSNLTDFANNFHTNKMPLIQNKIDEHVQYGHILYDKEYTPQGLNYYTSCVEVNKQAKLPESLVKFEIPTNNYIVFKYIGLHPYNEITFLKFAHIFQTAQMQINEKRELTYHFEKIDLKKCTDTYCELDLFFPVHE